MTSNITSEPEPGCGSGLNSTSTMPDPILLWLELSAFIVIDVTGLVGNVLVIAVVVWNARMRFSANLFILNLSVADLMVSVLVTPMVIVFRYRRHWQITYPLCELLAFVNHTCLFASLFNLAVIAVNRAIAMKWYHRYHVFFSNTLCALYIFTTWFFSVLYASLPLMGWGLYKFDIKRFNCIFSREAAPTFSIFFSSCCVILPLVICAVAYAVVLNVFVKSRQNLRRFGVGAVTASRASEAILTKNLFIVWLAFFFCWLPMNVLFIVDPKGHLSTDLYTVAVWLMLCNSCLNPIIYGVRGRFRAEYLLCINKFRGCIKGRSRVAPIAQTSDNSTRTSQLSRQRHNGQRLCVTTIAGTS